ncbi:hypothetical protein JTE90_016140 [Oedothorax gibbosus]|uniref:Protein kinase domain-containing protein n=1 Tax=Oedothorax gibbosus TaxID=931172 RepID=A0AAV6U6W7_9ARAC|nr:hypothetical protein JTE90_016140 [Oedothorax gibbosus]
MEDRVLCRPSILKCLKNNNNIKTKLLLGNGKFLVDIFPNQEALAKVVTIWNEGEFVVWPSLRHENLIALLDLVTIDEGVSVFISPYMKFRLGSLIEEASFMHHPKCFDRKKSYARDVLNGLEYLHQLSVSLMNLNDQNVLICSENDRAFISDFSSCDLEKTAVKSRFSIDKIRFLPPELNQLQDNDLFECMPIDMWAFGVLILQIFTKHILPDINDSKDILSQLAGDILLVANPGSYLTEETTNRFKEFIEPFLQDDPLKRMDAKTGAGLYFLGNSTERLDKQAWDFWRVQDIVELLSKTDQSKVPPPKSVRKSNVHTLSSDCRQEFDSRQEKDPWGEIEERQKISPKQTSSKSLPKHGISSLISTICKDYKTGSHVTCSKSDEDDHRGTSPLPLPLTSTQLSDEHFPHEIKEDSVENSKTHENSLSSVISLMKSRWFTSPSFTSEETCVDTKFAFPGGLSRRNAFRFKQESTLKTQFRCRPSQQQVTAESKPNLPSLLRDASIHGDQVDERTMTLLLNGMFCYNFKSTSAGKQSEKVEEAKHCPLSYNTASKRMNSDNYEGDVDLPLFANVKETMDEKFVKKKAANRFLRFLCPGSKNKVLSTTALHSDISN